MQIASKSNLESEESIDNDINEKRTSYSHTYTYPSFHAEVLWCLSRCRLHFS